MTSTEKSYKNIIDRLKKLKKRDIIVAFLFGTTFTLFVLAVCLLAVFIIDAIIPLNVPARLAWWAITLIAFLFSFVFYLLLPLFKNRSLENMAIQVEKRFPKLQNSVINTLNLWKLRKHNEMGYSSELVDSAIEHASQKSSSVDFSELIDTTPLKKYSRALIIVGVLLALFAVIFPAQFSESAKRLANPRKPLPSGPQLQMTVYPGNIEMIKGEDLTIEVATKNVVPKEMTLLYGRTSEGLNSQQELRKVAKNRYSYQFKELSRSFYYRIQGDDVSSALYFVKVTEKPMVTNLTLEYFYPRYTGIPPKRSEENNGDITAIKGTKISIEAESNNALKGGNLVLSTGDTITMRLIHPKVVKSQFFVDQDFTYHIDLRDYLNSTNDNPIEYKVRALSDEYPVVNIISPGEDTDLTEDMLLPMTVSALDDYGIKTINLKYKKGTDGEEKLEKISDYDKETEITESFTWNLSDLNLLPEEVVIYYVEVYDNDTVSGPKRSVSGTYTVRFPSIYEIYEEVEEEQETQITDLEEVWEKSKEVQKSLEEIQREMLKDPEMTWEQRKEVESAMEKQKEMVKQVEEVTQNMEKTMEKMERNEAVTLETLEKMQEIQKLMNEIATDEMRDAMKKLQEAMETLSPEEIQKAMQNMEMSQEEYMKKLERTLGLLKQIKMEQQMEAAVQKAEELVRRQDEINRATEEAKQSDDKEKLAEKAKDQDSVKEDAEALQKDLEELSKQMQENGMNELSEKMKEMSKSLDQDQIPQDMQQASQKMKQGDFQQSQQSQQNAMKKLLQLSENLMNAQMQMQQSGMQEIMAGLQAAMKDLLYLSQNEEDLVEDIAKMQTREYDAYTDLADDQLILREGTNRVANQIYELSKKSFSIKPNIGRNLGKAMADMETTQENLENRRGRSAERAGTESVSALNKAIIGLMDSQKQCQQQGQQGQGGMQQLMQQLQQMAQQQQGINQGTQNLMEQMGGQQGLSMQTRAEMARLAAEQEMVKKSVEELAKEAADNANVLGRLDEIAEEADEVAKKLKGNNVDEDLIDRQQRIMTRLLDAQRSLRKQDYSRKRKANVGEDVVRQSPDQIRNLGERGSSLREDLLRAMKEGYPMEYEHLIKAYFRALSGGQQD